MVRVAILGAAGRMGRNLIAAFAASGACVVTVAVDRKDHPLLGQDSGIISGLGGNNIPLTADLASHADEFDVAIDFTIPEASVENAKILAQLGKCLAIGTTGLTAGQTEQLTQHGQQTPILFAPNMSVGVNLCFKLLEFAANILGETTDIEIIEAHHKHKIDAPSGTALRMGEIIANELGRDLNRCAVYGREGRTGARDPNTIGFETIRAGDIVGEHTVMFASEGERIEITHKATSRMNFAQGAVRAASWLVSQPPGLYSMQDVLGLKLSS